MLPEYFNDLWTNHFRHPRAGGGPETAEGLDSCFRGCVVMLYPGSIEFD